MYLRQADRSIKSTYSQLINVSAHSRFLGGVQAKVDFSLILLHHLVANVTKLAVLQGTQLNTSKTPPKCNLKIEPNLENELYGDCADNVDTV